MFGFSKKNQISSGIITIGGVPMSPDQEVVHTLISGSTGVGKSTAIQEMVEAILARGDRAIIVDPDGFFISKFCDEFDFILNFNDKRSVNWTGPMGEIRKTYDFDKIARSVIPDGHGNDASWHFYAQVLLSETMRSLMSKGKGTTEELIFALTVMPSDELKQLVIGSAAIGLFDKDSAKALASTRFILTSYLKPFNNLKSGGHFGLRSWLESKQQKLFISWREDMTASLAPLISCQVDILINAILSMPADPEMGKRRTWLVIDELASVGKISSLEDAVSKGRKQNLRVIAGMQGTAQLDRVYGRESAIILRSCFRNLVAFSVAKSDPDTADFISRALGERELDRSQKTIGISSQGKSSSFTAHRVRERLVLPSELTELPNLTAFLALAGEQPTRRIKLTPRNLPQRTQGIVED